MSKDTLSFDSNYIYQAVKQFWTPFHLYDEAWILNNLQELFDAFWPIAWFREYYAVKTCPNPYIMEILYHAWCGMDCSSLWELLLCEAVWIRWENIMFTSNNTQVSEYKKAQELWAIINFDDITHIKYFQKHIWELPELVCFRYNPGPLKSWNVIIWNPEDAKYWLTLEQIYEAYTICKSAWVKRFGLHTMVASNELEVSYFLETVEILFELASNIEKKVWIQFEFINLWGWIGIPYKPESHKVDISILSNWIQNIYKKYFQEKSQPNIVMECGRYITWPYWYLVAQAIHTKDIYKKYIWVDACMAHLMRPGMYGAYHHISVIWKEHLTKNHVYDIVWSLCENNDKFAIDRKLPQIDVWDILVIHDTWAHGFAMGFNYNAKLRSKEILLKQNGELQLIRRDENYKDLFATLNYPNL